MVAWRKIFSSIKPPVTVTGNGQCLRPREPELCAPFLYQSLDWFKGKSTGNHGFYHGKYGGVL